MKELRKVNQRLIDRAFKTVAIVMSSNFHLPKEGGLTLIEPLHMPHTVILPSIMRILSTFRKHLPLQPSDFCNLQHCLLGQYQI
jgi:hypothetical protein